CMLCGQAEDKPDMFGIKVEHAGCRAHLFCLVMAVACALGGGIGSLAALRLLLIGAALSPFQKCFVCRQSGAANTSSEMGCNRSFHLPCAREGGCITQHLPHYRSFCCLHRPDQAVE
ncbi:PHF7 protein, partial [Upupa epops]|nr:PHF7 protein [Upupa epops]